MTCINDGALTMPFYISPKVFKQQTKTIMKEWPFPTTTTTAHVRNILSQIYGYKNSHQYQQLNKIQETNIPRINSAKPQKIKLNSHSPDNIRLDNNSFDNIELNNNSFNNNKLDNNSLDNNSFDSNRINSNNLNKSSLVHISQATVVQHFTLWVQRLAELAPMNEIQAKKLIYKVWQGYLQDNIDSTQKLYQCQFEFKGDCCIFLDEALRDSVINYSFDDKPSVKDAIEALGIPHTEVLAIKMRTFNKTGAVETFVDFNHKLGDTQHFTIFSTPDYYQLLDDNAHNNDFIALPYKPKNKFTFLLDVHLGGLARYLRMAGFDCLFDNKDYGDAFLAEFAHAQDLVLLTRDINLLKRSKVKYGRWVRNILPEAQFHEIIQHYQLQDKFQPFKLCIKCNGTINSVAKEDIIKQLPVGVADKIADFKQCSNCQQVYWQGSHYDKIKKILAKAQLSV